MKRRNIELFRDLGVHTKFLFVMYFQAL